MRSSTVLAITIACVGLYGQGKVLSPQASRMEPKNAKPGSVVTVTGVALDKSHVAEAYLTDHRFDLQVKILEQTDTMLKIRVPPFVKAGRQQLLLLMKGPELVYLEQPVYVLIELEESSISSTGSSGSGDKAGGAGASNHPDKQ